MAGRQGGGPAAVAGPISRVLSSLAGTSAPRTPFIAALGTAMVLGGGLLDWATGSELSFSIFYLLPVSLVALAAGRSAGIAISLASAATWLVADLASGARYSSPLIHYWNAAVRLGFFLIVTFLLSAVQQASKRDRRRRRTLEAVNEVAHGILAGHETDEVLRLIGRHAREMLGGALAFVSTREADGVLLVRAAEGVHADELEGLAFDEHGSVTAEAMRTKAPVVLADAGSDPRRHLPMMRIGDIGPALFVPLTISGTIFGTLSVGRLRGGRPFSEDDLEVLHAFATEAGVALQYGEIRNELQRLAVVEEREHIAKDLYERMGQSLFGVGMLLHAADSHENGAGTHQQLSDAADEIDRVMAELRRYIHELSPRLPIDPAASPSE